MPGVNLKAVHRIWKAEGLRLTHKVRRKLRVEREPVLPLTAPRQSWSIDFASVRLESGRQARVLAVLDSFTRELLLLKAAAHSSHLRSSANWNGSLWCMTGRLGLSPTTVRSSELSASQRASTQPSSSPANPGRTAPSRASSTNSAMRSYAERSLPLELNFRKLWKNFKTITITTDPTENLDSEVQQHSKGISRPTTWRQKL